MVSGFSGSYPGSDVEILLKPIELPNTPVHEKERLIQVEKRHYSEMLTRESLPSQKYLNLFETIFSQNQARLGLDLLTLAAKIARQKTGEIVLISLARAGTPIGVLLKRILSQHFGRDCQHYSISIIRDRGIDTNALNYILQKHDNQAGFTFIDGWTGKGVIARELRQSMDAFNQQYGTCISPDLYVLNDIAGVAAVTASFADYLIPSSLLNATVSGLISRSILNRDYISADDFHGCVYYHEFVQHDLSNWFIDEIMSTVSALTEVQTHSCVQKQHWLDRLGTETIDKAAVQQQASAFMQELQETYQISDINLIKPGIGEATRVLLRRLPDLLLVKDQANPETEHLLLLAQEKQIPVIETPSMPYQAVAIIKELSHD